MAISCSNYDKYSLSIFTATCNNIMQQLRQIFPEKLSRAIFVAICGLLGRPKLVT